MFRLLDRVEVVRDIDVPWYPQPYYEAGYPDTGKTMRVAAGWVGNAVAIVRSRGRRQTVISVGPAAGYALVDDDDLRAAPDGR